MNIWLHSFVLIALGTPLLAAARWMAFVATGSSASIDADPARMAAQLAAPLAALALLLPGLLLGWHTRRHPLLVGAAIGLTGTLLFLAVSPLPLGVHARVGDAVAAALIVAVAALAGRALRWRLRPATA